MRTEQEFLPRPECVAEVRKFVRAVLGEDADLTERAVLLASELATNAVLHARTSFTVSVSTGDDRVRLEVCDGNDRLPSPAVTMTAASTSGRGLIIVEAVADAWGAERTADGKRLWYELYGDADPAR